VIIIKYTDHNKSHGKDKATTGDRCWLYTVSGKKKPIVFSE